MAETPIRLLILGAHPDDAEGLCGGTLALLATITTVDDVLAAWKGAP